MAVGAVSLTTAALPVAAALVAGLFAARLGGACLARPAAHRLFWAFGFLLFAAGSAAEAYGASYGWSALDFRIYYLCGGVLAVALLGLGSAWLVLPRSVALVCTGAVLVAVPAAAVAVFAAPVHEAALAVARLRPPPNDALGGLAYLWAIALNTAGTLVLVGGAAWSIWRGRARAANALIAAGVVVVASSGVLTRVAGTYAAVYAGQLLGLVLIYAGFELAVHPRMLPSAPLPRPPARGERRSMLRRSGA